MRIYTLGTGHGDSTFNRFNSSTVYETADGTLYMIDAGAPVEALLRRKGLRIKDLRATFITHMHDDHAGGLSGLLKQIIKYPSQNEQPFCLYLPEERAILPLKNWIFALHENADSDQIAYRAVTDGMIYDDENLTVTAIRTKHLRTEGRTKGTPCSFAYVLEFKKEQLTVLHTGDLWMDFSDFPKIASQRHFDVCLCEATHYQPEDALPALRAAQLDRLIFIHISDRWHTHVYDGWRAENGEKELLCHFTGLPYPVCVAHDGDEFLF